MLRGLHAIRQAFAGTGLEKAQMLELPVAGSREQVALVEVTHEGAFDAWGSARDRVLETGRWPMLITYWGFAHPADFSCFRGDVPWGAGSSFADEPLPLSTPKGRLAAAADLSIELALERRDRTYETWGSQGGFGTDDILDIALEETRLRCGTAPSKADTLAAAEAGDDASPLLALNRYLAAYEAERNATITAEPFAWFEPDASQPMALALLPTASSSAGPAYLSWFAASDAGTPLVVAMLERWGRRFGAELVAHYGTMLEFVVASPPGDFDTALDLAWEHYLLAPCTLELPLTSLREYAHMLMSGDTWFLHERP